MEKKRYQTLKKIALYIVIAGTEQNLLNEFIEIAKNSNDFAEAFKRIVKLLPPVEIVDDDELTDEECNV